MSKELTTASDTPLKKADWPKCKKLIENLEADPMSQPFLFPVGWKQMQLYDYPKIIEKPMDLDTVKSNLMGGKYGTFEEFLADIQLIWDNCRLYNMVGSSIYN